MTQFSDDPRAAATWTRTALFALSALALNQAIEVVWGLLAPRAMIWLAVACAACLCGVLALRIPAIEVGGPKTVFGVLAVALALQFAQFQASVPGPFLASRKTHLVKLIVAGVTLLTVVALTKAPRLQSFFCRWFPAIVAAHFALGVWILHAAQTPKIDVLIHQQDASAALLHGVNPYSITIPNIYGENTPYYTPSVVVNGRLINGFPYPPLSLFLCLPGHVLAGDVRYSHLLAITLAGLVIGFTGKGLLSRLAAGVYLFSPFGIAMIQSAWTEPFVVLLLSAVVFLSTRRGRPPWLALGLFLASKQYLIWALPAAWLLIRERSWRAYADLVLRSGAVTLAVTLPLALWGFRDFFRCVILFQMVQPFRADSLSLTAWLVSLGLPRLPIWLPFAAAIAAVALVLWKRESTVAAFPGGLALIYLVFFCLNKQAFGNYYFFVVGCLCCAVATADAKAPRHSEPAAPARAAL